VRMGGFLKMKVVWVCQRLLFGIMCRMQNLWGPSTVAVFIFIVKCRIFGVYQRRLYRWFL